MNRTIVLGMILLLAFPACLPEHHSLAEEVPVRNVSVAYDEAVTGSRLYVCLSETGEMVAAYPSDNGECAFWLPDETYDFCAVVNAPGLASWYGTRDELLSAVTRLDDNAPESLIMTGILSDHVVQADEKITVGVHRIAAKVSFTLRTDFDSIVVFDRFFVRSAYLTNVVASADLKGSPLSEGPWYNKMGYTGDRLAGMLQAEIGLTMARCDSLVPETALYAYPNACADSRDKQQWSPRRTRLVVEAQLDSVVTYYPVTFPEIKPNTHYHVDITLKYLGTEHPEDDPVDHRFASVAIRVEPWSGGPVHEWEI